MGHNAKGRAVARPFFRRVPPDGYLSPNLAVHKRFAGLFSFVYVALLIVEFHAIVTINCGRGSLNFANIRPLWQDCRP